MYPTHNNTDIIFISWQIETVEIVEKRMFAQTNIEMYEQVHRGHIYNVFTFAGFESRMRTLRELEKFGKKCVNAPRNHFSIPFLIYLYQIKNLSF